MGPVTPPWPAPASRCSGLVRRALRAPGPPVEPSADGTALLPYGGPALTLGGELQKLAANVAIGRNGAGIHWLTDYYRSLRLGEYVAKTILEEQKASYNQSPTFQFTSFDGHAVTI